MPAFKIELEDKSCCAGCPMLEVFLSRRCWWCRILKKELKPEKVTGDLKPIRPKECVKKYGV